MSGLVIYKQLLDDQRSLPAHQSSKDAITLVNYILRKFFKSMEQDPFLAVEAFFPKASQGKSVRGFGAASGSEDDGDASDVNVKRARKKVNLEASQKGVPSDHFWCHRWRRFLPISNSSRTVRSRGASRSGLRYCN